MHIYNWYHSITTGILLCTQIQITIYMAHSPCFFTSPCWITFAPLSNPLYLLGTLLAVTWSVHLGLRLLVNWPPLSQPFSQSLPPPNSQNPGYQAPYYDDLKNPASSVRNNNSFGRLPSFALNPLVTDLVKTWGHFIMVKWNTRSVIKLKITRYFCFTFDLKVLLPVRIFCVQDWSAQIILTGT